MFDLDVLYQRCIVRGNFPSKKTQFHWSAFEGNETDLVFPDLRRIDLSNDFFLQRTIAFKTSALDKFLRKYVVPQAGISAI